MDEGVNASMHASMDEIHAARIARMDAVDLVNDVLNLPDAPGNRELLTLANVQYLNASEDLMKAWDRMEV